MRVKITIVTVLLAGSLQSCSIEEKLTKKKDAGKKSSPSSSDATEGSGRFKDANYLCVPEETEDGALALADAPSWDGAVGALVQKDCAACHGAGGKPYAPDLSSYDATKAAGDSVVQEVVAGTMPTSGKLPDADVATFQAWADGGYQKAATAPAPAPAPAQPRNDDPLESNRCPVPADDATDGTADGATDGATDGGGAKLVGYDQLKSFIDGKCATCHAAGATAPDLSDYAKAKAGGVRSNVRIQANTMPPGGGLTADEQALFQQWVDGGFAEKGE